MSIDKKASGIEYNGGFYEEIGDFIRDNYLKFGFTKGTIQEVDFLVELMSLKPNNCILDIGCGPGRHSLELARRGFKSVGVDISSEFIKYANQAAINEKLNAEFLVADARELTFNQEFDAAICLCEGAFGLAGSEENHRNVLRGVHQSLRAGSLFILTVVNALNLARNVNDESHFDPYSCTIIDKDEVISPERRNKRSIYLYYCLYFPRIKNAFRK
ncbi:hypothetical protein A3842_00075 [Paenibacillus sp. P3E]|uniref:class I SAM-dependent methyltransferase n=1 Tax=Paenibacillus sp. P3E TaxID=1349435 RepID=UPI00093EEC40|nr:class I SAM-dependent methyltransferase [Paenibacillus sp. P3E]OKP93085.1 hypothetical protein A3842_00075 [Paenibacillus sp. P3E]